MTDLTIEQPTSSADIASSDGEINGFSTARVTYLLGAGATHGGALAYGSSVGILMNDLSETLVSETRELVVSNFRDNSNLTNLANTVIDAATDYEHIITFLDDSVSNLDRQFAQGLREIFSRVLRERLEKISTELEGKQSRAYATLIDLHNVDQFPELLMGFMTLNYDDFLETAIEADLGKSVDFGVRVGPKSELPSIKVLKLHGSFSWGDEWPVERVRDGDRLWIAPGIRKKKTDYPFNSIWGKARELLDCDVLRIVGCNLGANDWDLISLLFTTKHLNAKGTRYQVELITDFKTSERVKTQYPYLGATHFIENPLIGPKIIGELLSSGPVSFDTLTEEKRNELGERFDDKIRNPILYWLTQMVEAMTLGYNVSTEAGFVQSFIDEFVVAG
jgi:hypothetical protein